MTKNLVVTAIVALIVTALCAQTPTHKRIRTVPNTKAPTKVTGDGIKTDSGLQYWDIRVGTGGAAQDGGHVKIRYTGWLTTGKKFDSSVDAHQPFDFTIGNSEVIKGWDEGVTGMKVGGKRQLRIPPELAYGADGHPPEIPQNVTPIFDVKLLGVSPSAK